MYMCMYVYMYMFVYVCIYLYVCVYIYVYTHTHICSFVCVSFFRGMDDPYRQTPFAGTVDHPLRLERC